MFFIGIFGIESRSKEIREIQNIICKNCKAMSVYKLVKNYSYFQFFFIPIFKWNIRYYLISRCCSTVFEIPKEIGEALEEGKNIQINDLDLKEVQSGNTYNEKKVCPHCGRQIDEEFPYCPYCGKKIR